MQSDKQVFQGLSSRTKALLARQENADVDFKKTFEALSADDLVAFANSPKGGSILLGVEETQSKRAVQRGVVVGCDIGDKAKQSILSKAESCIPPVRLEIFIENAASKPFLRIEIPWGQDSPYCTSGGTYKIRGDGRNRAMYPAYLLSVFMEKEAERFFARFRSASQVIDKAIAKLKDHLIEEFRAMNDETDQLRSSLEDSIQQIGTVSEEAQTNSEAASDEIWQIVKSIKEILEDDNSLAIAQLRAKLDAILVKLEIADPAVRLNQYQIWNVLMGAHLDGKSKDECRQIFKQLHPASSDAQFEDYYTNATAPMDRVLKNRPEDNHPKRPKHQ